MSRLVEPCKGCGTPIDRQFDMDMDGLCQKCKEKRDKENKYQREQNKWKEDWPQKEGFYWFYGYLTTHSSEEPKLHFVEVFIGGQGQLIYITKSMFLYKQETGHGLWMPITLPELPNIDKG